MGKDMKKDAIEVGGDIEKGTIGVSKDTMDQSLAIQPAKILPGGMSYDQERHDQERYNEELYEFVYNKTSRKKMVFGQFGMFHRLNLVDIQNDIAKCRAAILEGKSASKAVREKLRVTLREYVQAVRDWDYMERMAPCKYHDAINWRADLENTFTKIASEHNHPYSTKYMVLEEIKLPGEDTLRTILTKIFGRLAYRTKKDWEEAKQAKKEQAEEEAKKRAEVERAEDEERALILRRTQPQENSRFVNDLVFSLPRFFITFICGASLIAPMIIMTLHKSQTKSLITTSVAVVLVAALLAYGPYVKAKNSDIIAATAAYAAVLVVFVGVSS